MEVCLDQLSNKKDPNDRLWRSKDYICYFFFNKNCLFAAVDIPKPQAPNCFSQIWSSLWGKEIGFSTSQVQYCFKYLTDLLFHPPVQQSAQSREMFVTFSKV